MLRVVGLVSGLGVVCPYSNNFIIFGNIKIYKKYRCLCRHVDPTLFPPRQLAPGECTCIWIRILTSTSDMLMVRPFYAPTPALLLIGAGATGKTGLDNSCLQG